MKNMLYCLICNILLVALVFILASCSGETVALVPAPVDMELADGEFTIDENTVISSGSEEFLQAGRWFAGLFEEPAGFVPEVTLSNDNADIRLHLDEDLATEAYCMTVDSEGIDIYASSSSGIFYGLQTLRMVLPPAISGRVRSNGEVWSVPAMTVCDSPRFEYRGLMVDVSRCFLPKENLMEIIDCMAMLKLNNLHLHLTDDNGWRLEIKKYPLLTSVGAWRVDRGDIPFPDRKNPERGEPTPVGGFYTQEDIGDIVAYAAERHINVIPEIDIPAHFNSALAAYPQYACPVVDRYIGVLPGLGGRNADIICCAGNDESIEFLKNIIDEVCSLFPSRYIHLGGDEAWKTYWEICPLCQNRIKKECLDDEAALQGWLMSQMNDHLMSKGKIMMGWDEITDSEVPEGAVVFGWQGNGEAALKAAQKGHRFVMTPSEKLYLIRYQGPQWFEPLTYFGNSTLKDVYGYEPVQETWTEDVRGLLLGIQGSMWTEFCDCPEDVTRQIFPRLAAVAEVAWSPAKSKDWCAFIDGVDVFDSHLDVKGVEYSRAMYNIQHKVVPTHDRLLKVSLSCERPDVHIRYTFDGSSPDFSSDVFPGSIKSGRPVVLKAATFDRDGMQKGETLVLSLGWNEATASPASGSTNAGLLVNGVRGSLKQTDFEWVHCSGTSEFVFDLGKETGIRRVSVGMLTNYGMAFHKPAELSVWLSADGSDYRCVGRKRWTEDEIFCEGNFIEEAGFYFEKTYARYVKIVSEGPERCPDDHLRPGQVSRYCFDEVEVYETYPLGKGVYGKSVPIRFNSGVGSEDSSVSEKVSDRSRKNMFRWADLSMIESGQ